MFDTRKRVFANKRNTLYAKPLCPYITDNAGYNTLSRRNSLKFNTGTPKSGRTTLR